MKSNKRVALEKRTGTVCPLYPAAQRSVHMLIFVYIYTKIYIMYIYKYIYSVQAWWKDPHLQKACNPTVAQAFQPGQ